MKRLLFGTLLFLISCSGNNTSTSDNAVSIDKSQSVDKQNAQKYIKQAAEEIPQSLKIQNEDLSSWVDEGLITTEESIEISENL